VFRNGLSLPLQVWYMSFNALVSVVIEQEGTYRALLVEGEKKRVLLGPSEDGTGVLH
jgi:hypothetical protein